MVPGMDSLLWSWPQIHPLVGSPQNSHATITPVGASHLPVQYHSVQHPALGKTIGVFSPSVWIAPFGPMKAEHQGRSFPTQFQADFFKSWNQSMWCPRQQGLSYHLVIVGNPEQWIDACSLGAVWSLSRAHTHREVSRAQRREFHFTTHVFWEQDCSPMQDTSVKPLI